MRAQGEKYGILESYGIQWNPMKSWNSMKVKEPNENQRNLVEPY